MRNALALAALLAVAVLLARPAALDALDMPFGSFHSETVQLVKADGAHCELLADCETVSIGNIGLSPAGVSIVTLVTGLVIAFAVTRPRLGADWRPLVPNPPPLASLR